MTVQLSSSSSSSSSSSFFPPLTDRPTSPACRALTCLHGSAMEIPSSQRLGSSHVFSAALWNISSSHNQTRRERERERERERARERERERERECLRSEEGKYITCCTSICCFDTPHHFRTHRHRHRPHLLACFPFPSLPFLLARFASSFCSFRTMKCFPVIQKPKRRPSGSDKIEPDLPAEASLIESSPVPSPRAPALGCAPQRSFKSRVRAIQIAQRFIYSASGSGGRSSSSNPSKLGSPPADEGTILGYGNRGTPVVSANAPMPLPSPPSAGFAYQLPLPREQANTSTSTSISRPSSSSSSAPPNPSSSSSSASSTASSMAKSAHINISRVVPTTTDSSPTPPLSSSSSSSSSSSTVLPPDEKRNPSAITVVLIKEKGSNSKTPGSQPLPLPKVPIFIPGLSHFRYEELASACHDFSPHVTSSYGDGICYSGTLRVNAKPKEIVAVLVHNRVGFLEMVAEISQLGRRHGAHFCKIVGYTGGDDDLESPHAIVYEMLPRGSLSSILFDAVLALDWPTRMKIAAGAAHAILTLHETYPAKGLSCDIRTSYVQVDEDYTSKLAGYKFDKITEHGDNTTKPSNPRIHAYTAPETVTRGEVTLKSHVWSFGVILLELLSGKQHMDEAVTKDEKQNLVKWAKPFLDDDGTLFLVMDPKLQGKFPSRGARLIGDLVLSCLEMDPVKRPNMKEVFEVIKSVHEVRYKTARPQAKEMSATKGSKAKPTSLSSPLSADGQPTTMASLVVAPQGIRSHDQFDVIQGPQLRPLVIPSRGCATTYAMDDYIHHHHHHAQQDYQSAPLGRISGF